MRTSLVSVVLIGTIVAAAACSDTTAPKPAPRLATITNIVTTSHAGTGDTVKISFTYFPASCDTGVVVEARPNADGLRFTVTSWPTDRACTLAPSLSIIAPPPVGYIVSPPHISPLRLVFTQPGGTDSVRVVGP
jgi:hypothetical protein